MAEIIMARVEGRGPKGIVVSSLPIRPHPDTCWCRLADVAFAALQKAQPLPQRR